MKRYYVNPTNQTRKLCRLPKLGYGVQNYIPHNVYVNEYGGFQYGRRRLSGKSYASQIAVYNPFALTRRYTTESGRVLWEVAWKTSDGVRIAYIDERDLMNAEFVNERFPDLLLGSFKLFSELMQDMTRMNEHCFPPNVVDEDWFDEVRTHPEREVLLHA